jgi:hypothetical protein
LKRAAGEQSCWEAVSKWNEVAEQLGHVGMAGQQPESAEKLASLIATVADSLGETAECQTLRRLVPYLKAIARRQEGGERIEAALRKLLTEPLLASAWMIELQSGERYYTTAEPDLEKPVSYVAGLDGDTRDKRFTEDERKHIKYRGRAPQAAVVGKLATIADELSDGNWVESFGKMLAVLQADQEMDPILKTNLLEQVLETGTRGSHCMEKAYAAHLKWLKAAKIKPFTNWVDPEHPVGIQTRVDAKRRLEDFPDVSSATQAAIKEWSAVAQQKITNYSWIGWLQRARDGRWVCLTARTPGAAGTLLVAYQNTAGGKPVLAPIGRLDSGKAPAIDLAAGSLLLGGRPIYLAVP